MQARTATAFARLSPILGSTGRVTAPTRSPYFLCRSARSSASTCCVVAGCDRSRQGKFFAPHSRLNTGAVAPLAPLTGTRTPEKHGHWRSYCEVTEAPRLVIALDSGGHGRRLVGDRWSARGQRASARHPPLPPHPNVATISPLRLLGR